MHVNWNSERGLHDATSLPAYTYAAAWSGKQGDCGYYGDQLP